MRDEIRVPAGRLDESQLAHLRAVCASMAVSANMTSWERRWYASLAHALNETLADRAVQWLAVLEDPAVPPSWDEAVAALPDGHGTS